MRIKAKEPVKKVVKAVAKGKDKPVQTKTRRTAPKTQRILFSVRAEVGSQVSLAGSFNNWDPTAKPMTDKKGDGVYTVTVSLAPGTYEYKFVIDGTWCADPDCADWVQNEHGTLNSVKYVR
ncbi:MAG TPA: glycogen-binding domain-containing protein [Kiritimatiellia bacterium]|nr:glycogen-binding domain-containing protein [Kiritimatiellia bacterium]HOR98291.1 glycogen-binding domain-containing protein [Kiritimatiellia bacterium]HPC48816.1 glycogen-binding domain-containing protein [Kiritimatiellia bacterium]HPK37549.1 glycogen-binding domain-containing protein [Kiritimatiellia bacterium]HPW75839.1 glycogen-binding domain-containing protein [Kiritimatiellia bacterium]